MGFLRYFKRRLWSEEALKKGSGISGTGDPSSMEGGGMREADPCLDAYNAQLDSWFGGPSGGFNVDRWMNDFIGGYDTRDFEWEKDFLNDHRDSFGPWDMSDVDAEHAAIVVLIFFGFSKTPRCYGSLCN